MRRLACKPGRCYVALRVIIDDLASISRPTVVGEVTDYDDVEVSTLREPGDLQTLTANGFADADNAPAAIVTADARLGSVAGGARRVADVGLLAALVDNPDAVFQYFAFWTPPDRLSAASTRYKRTGSSHCTARPAPMVSSSASPRALRCACSRRRASASPRSARRIFPTPTTCT